MQADTIEFKVIGVFFCWILSRCSVSLIAATSKFVWSRFDIWHSPCKNSPRLIGARYLTKVSPNWFCLAVSKDWKVVESE